MTYGDYIRSMDDDQLACLLNIVKVDGWLLHDIESYDMTFKFNGASAWYEWLRGKRPDGIFEYGII